MKKKKLMMGAVLLLALVMNTSALAGEVQEDKENNQGWADEENENKKIERRWAGVYKYVSEVFSTLSSEEQEAIAQSIYQEKYVIVPEAAPSDDAPNDASVKEQEESIFQGKFVPEAYYLMMKRENYIVDLITSHSGTETTIEAWEYNLDYLNAHYEEIMSLENVNQIYVEIYIEEYEAQREVNKRKANNMSLGRINGSRTFDWNTFMEIKSSVRPKTRL